MVRMTQSSQMCSYSPMAQHHHKSANNIGFDRLVKTIFLERVVKVIVLEGVVKVIILEGVGYNIILRYNV